MAVLTGFSLVIEEGENSFGTHRLVQVAVRKWLELHNSKEKWQEKALSLLAAKSPLGEYENWETCQALLSHAYAVLRYGSSTETSRLHRMHLLKNLARYELRRG